MASCLLPALAAQQRCSPAACPPKQSCFAFNGNQRARTLQCLALNAGHFVLSSRPQSLIRACMPHLQSHCAQKHLMAPPGGNQPVACMQEICLSVKCGLCPGWRHLVTMKMSCALARFFSIEGSCSSTQPFPAEALKLHVVQALSTESAPQRCPDL